MCFKLSLDDSARLGAAQIGLARREREGEREHIGLQAGLESVRCLALSPDGLAVVVVNNGSSSNYRVFSLNTLKMRIALAKPSGYRFVDILPSCSKTALLVCWG